MVKANDVIKKINSSWTEKYRPKKIDELALDDDILSFIDGCVKNGNVPNLLLYGSAGTGKGSIINVLLENISSDVLYCDCSLDTGIDFIREKIFTFAGAGQFDKNKAKIIILNESDRLSIQAMDSLKQSLEEFDQKCRFIFACNRINKMSEPIRSRCIEFEIKSNKDKFYNRIMYILESENIDYDKKIIKNICDKYYPDMRKTINKIYELFSIHGKIKDISLDINETIKYEEMFNKIFNKKTSIKEIVNILKSSLYSEDIFSEMAKWFIENDSQPEIIIIISEGDYRSNIVYDKDLNIFSTILSIRELIK